MQLPRDLKNPELAQRALAVMAELPLVDAGARTFGEVWRPWMTDFVARLFGSIDPETGASSIKEAFLLIAKKNGKSTLAAGMMVTALVLGWRRSAEYLIVAPTIEIAQNSFQPARDMVREHPVLASYIQVQEHLRIIRNERTGATLKVVSADRDTVSGKRASIILVDELWLFGPRADGHALLREMVGGLAARPEGWIVYLSTQSDDPPAGIFASKLRYARGVRDGKISDPKFLSVIYEPPAEAIPAALEELTFDTLRYANPNLGASVDDDFLSRQLQMAREAGGAELRAFAAKHANIEIGAGGAGGWVVSEFWPRLVEPDLTLDTILSTCDLVTVGIDGGGRDDLLAAAVVGRHATTGRWLVWVKAWAHEIVLQRRKSETQRFLDFVERGDLSIVASPRQDMEELGAFIERIDASGLLDQIGIDPYSVGDIPETIADAGIDKERVIGIPQGWRMIGAIKTVERRAADGAIRHGGQPLMNWSIGNARVEQTASGMRISKAAAGVAKVDPVIAMLNAAWLMAGAHARASGGSPLLVV